MMYLKFHTRGMSHCPISYRTQVGINEECRRQDFAQAQEGQGVIKGANPTTGQGILAAAAVTPAATTAQATMLLASTEEAAMAEAAATLFSISPHVNF